MVLFWPILRQIWFSLFQKMLLELPTSFFSVSSGYLQPSIPQESPHHLSNLMLTGMAPHSKCSAWLRNEILASLPRAFWGSTNTLAGITGRWQQRSQMERCPSSPWTGSLHVPQQHCTLLSVTFGSGCTSGWKTDFWCKKLSYCFKISLRYSKFDLQHKHLYFKILKKKSYTLGERVFF